MLDEMNRIFSNLCKRTAVAVLLCSKLTICRTHMAREEVLGMRLRSFRFRVMEKHNE